MAAIPLREARKQETRRALLTAAEDVLALRGLSEAKVEEIADRAGVAVGTIYNHFRDRDELVEELLAVRRNELEERIGDAQEASRRKPLAARIEAVTRAAFEQFQAHPGFLQVALEIEHQKSMSALRSKGGAMTSLRLLYDAAQALVEAGIAAGELKPEPPAIWASLLTGTVRGLLIHELHHNGTRTAEELARLATDFFIAGAAVPANSPQSQDAKAEARS